jgi:hypothetical protein
VDPDARVENRIADGQRVLEYLPQNGFAVAAGLWLKPSVDGRWHFYLVSPVVDAEGLPKAYGRLHTLIRQMPGPVGIDPLEIKLIGLENPIAKDVLAIHTRAAGPRVSPMRWGGRSLGNRIIEGAYLYPLPAVAA